MEYPAETEFEKFHISTIEDFFAREDYELLEATGFHYNELKAWKKRICHKYSPSILSADQLGSRCCLTGIPVLDRLFNGGFPTGTLNEIVGPSAAGKTQWCMSMVASNLLADSSFEALYIDVDRSFNPKRLVEMANAQRGEGALSEDVIRSLLCRLHLVSPPSWADFWNRLLHLNEYVRQHPVQLIIIDCITSLIRREYASSTHAAVIERSRVLNLLVTKLKAVAEMNNLTVLVTNQPTQKFATSIPGPLLAAARTGQMNDSRLVPALGPAWSHFVTTRVLLQFVDSRRRELVLAKTPMVACVGFQFQLSSAGLLAEEDTLNYREDVDPACPTLRTQLDSQ